MRIRIKICGLTRQADIIAAADAGADAIGFVFHPPSKRYVTVDQAAELRRIVPPFVSVVTLLVNAEPAFVNEVIQKVQPTFLQFHGDETPQTCQQYGHPYWKAFRVGGPELKTKEQIMEFCQQYPDAAAWLFDTYTPQYGGSGERFDWSILEKIPRNSSARPFILAGGIAPSEEDAQNLPSHLWGIDVSSSVEIQPGVKSKLLMEKLVDIFSAVKR